MRETLTLKDPETMAAWAEEQRRRGQRVALVPTMGYLHAGHLALVRRAQDEGDRVVVSIFVNPTQFGPNEDLARYPRDFDGDVTKLREAGVDVVFAPEAHAFYPQGFDSYVVPERLATGLCGASRPGHFRGVATVVLMLCHVTRADVAIFGEKDFQQLAVVRRMAQDLWLPTRIVGVPTVREPDGLAMSSRNVYLTPAARLQARALNQSLSDIAQQVQNGARDARQLENTLRQRLEATPGARVDYASIVDAQSLEPVAELNREAVAAVAVFFGSTRLIDNRRLPIPMTLS